MNPKIQEITIDGKVYVPKDESQKMASENGLPCVTWRDSARPLIAKALEETKGKSEKEIRAALKAAYPWGERRMHPYKIWCDEIKKQRGLKRKKQFIDKNQTGMFNG